MRVGLPSRESLDTWVWLNCTCSQSQSMDDIEMDLGIRKKTSAWGMGQGTVKHLLHFVWLHNHNINNYIITICLLSRYDPAGRWFSQWKKLLPISAAHAGASLSVRSRCQKFTSRSLAASSCGSSKTSPLYSYMLKDAGLGESCFKLISVLYCVFWLPSGR
jgi:hypothetical protein